MRGRARTTGVVLLAALLTMAMVAPAVAAEEGEPPPEGGDAVEIETRYIVEKEWDFLRPIRGEDQPSVPRGSASITLSEEGTENAETWVFEAGVSQPDTTPSSNELSVAGDYELDVTESLEGLDGWICQKDYHVNEPRSVDNGDTATLGEESTESRESEQSDRSADAGAREVVIPRIPVVVEVTNTCQPTAEVMIEKEWTVNGDSVEVDASPTFAITLDPQTADLSSVTEATTDGTADFAEAELFAGITYDVTVDEDADSIPDAAELFDLGEGEVCELDEITAGDDRVLPDTGASVVPGTDESDATVTVTNAYECTTSVEVDVSKVWAVTDDLDVPSDLEPAFTLEVLDADGDVVDEATVGTGTATFEELAVNGEYTLAWSEAIDGLDGFTADDERTCALSDDSTTSGEVAFVAGEEDSIEVAAENVYTCDEVVVLGAVEELDEEEDEETLPDTGASALLLSLLGLFGLGIGGGLLRTGRRR